MNILSLLNYVKLLIFGHLTYENVRIIGFSLRIAEEREEDVPCMVLAYLRLPSCAI